MLPTSENSKIPHSILVICYENFWCVIFLVFAGACPFLILLSFYLAPRPTLRLPPLQPPMSTLTLPPFSGATSNIHYVETFQINFLNTSVCQWTDSWNEVLHFISAGSIMFTSLKKLFLKTFCSIPWISSHLVTNTKIILFAPLMKSLDYFPRYQAQFCL